MRSGYLASEDGQRVTNLAWLYPGQTVVTSRRQEVEVF